MRKNQRAVVSDTLLMPQHGGSPLPLGLGDYWGFPMGHGQVDDHAADRVEGRLLGIRLRQVRLKPNGRCSLTVVSLLPISSWPANII